jgi:hypothetical protein
MNRRAFLSALAVCVTPLILGFRTRGRYDAALRTVAQMFARRERPILVLRDGDQLDWCRFSQALGESSGVIEARIGNEKSGYRVYKIVVNDLEAA